MLVWATGTIEETPPGSAWLSPAEAEKVASLGSPARRAEWRLGRWLAKRAVLACGFGTAAPPAGIEIRADHLGRPTVSVDGVPVAVAVSISHKRGRGVCFAARGAVRLGCDIELPARRRVGFAARWLLPTEQDIAASSRDPDAAATLIWSAKEATLKALGTGWRRPLASVEVSLDPSPAPAGWNPIAVRDNVEARTWSGWWQPLEHNVVTVVVDPPAPASGQRGPVSVNSTVV
ncbi:MAG: 4'-phosphopantetheinyl transferase superfamily protein [Acidimicrobiia bacterium]|nr:4'-phosphopantetheinyl transferase superfamily protein [Acidimicrobiia bacterium]